MLFIVLCYIAICKTIVLTNVLTYKSSNSVDIHYTAKLPAYSTNNCYFIITIITDSADGQVILSLWRDRGGEYEAIIVFILFCRIIYYTGYYK